MFKNNTSLAIENKIDQINACIQSIYPSEAVELVSVTCDDMGYATPNFTTSGIFRLHGLVKLYNELKPWSIIVKIIKPHTAEKDQCEHHNYWRREALVLESGVMKELPHFIKTPESYLVEEQQDGSIWIWMEYVKGEYANTVEQFSYIARQLGRFNGAYLTGVSMLPDHEWICRAWLKSWTTASRRYAPNMEAYVGPPQHRFSARIPPAAAACTGTSRFESDEYVTRHKRSKRRSTCSHRLAVHEYIRDR